ncbi:MAG: LysM domain-containing protein [Oscillospiraceae bacterium]|nr:LysM domain-containing protein [Oscillospiraceae bacterium]
MVIHVVRPGDTLASVAQEYGVPLSLLLSLNQPPDPNRLAVGQTLVVRFPAQVHTVQQGQSLLSIASPCGSCGGTIRPLGAGRGSTPARPWWSPTGTGRTGGRWSTPTPTPLSTPPCSRAPCPFSAI